MKIKFYKYDQFNHPKGSTCESIKCASTIISQKSCMFNDASSSEDALQTNVQTCNLHPLRAD